MQKIKSILSDLSYKFKNSITKYPTAIISATIIMLLALVKASWDFDYNVKTYTLLSIVQYGMLVNVTSSMALAAYKELNSKISIVHTSLLAILVPVLTMTYLYFFGIVDVNSIDNFIILNVASFRVSALAIISLVLFILLLAKYENIKTFTLSFYVFNHALFTALFYGIVLLLGFYSVIGAFQALVYNDMSYKIYSYLAIVIAYLVYLVFLGYLPKSTNEKFEVIKSNFVNNILNKVLVGIMLALGFVLVIWALRVLLIKVDIEFTTLSTIINAFVLFGLWLYIMVNDQTVPLVKFYKLAYLITSTLILIIQLFAFKNEYQAYGLTDMTLGVVYIWIFGISTIVILTVFKTNAFRKVAYSLIGVIGLASLPYVGMFELSYYQQKARLKDTLINEQMLVDDNIVAKADLDFDKRFIISHSFRYISNSQKTNSISWLDVDYTKNNFNQVFGFNEVYSLSPNENVYKYVNITLKDKILELDNFDYLLMVEYEDLLNTYKFEFDGVEYAMAMSKIDQFSLKANGELIVNQSLTDYFDELIDKYMLHQNDVELGLDGLSVTIDNSDVHLTIIFDYIELFYDNDKVDKFISIKGVYLSLK